MHVFFFSRTALTVICAVKNWKIKGSACMTLKRQRQCESHKSSFYTPDITVIRKKKNIRK